MALAVSDITTHARSFFKASSDFATAEEVRLANNVQSIVTGHYRWHWLLTAGTGVATVSGTQDYSFNSADQNKVMEIASANLLSGSTQLAELLVYSDPPLPLYSTTGQPIAVSVISPTAYRLWPTPGAVYTFQFRYYARPVVFTANTASYQCPDSFADVLKAGMTWQLMEWADDTRAPEWEKRFYGQLDRLVVLERRLMERDR